VIIRATGKLAGSVDGETDSGVMPDTRRCIAEAAAGGGWAVIGPTTLSAAGPTAVPVGGPPGTVPTSPSPLWLTAPGSLPAFGLWKLTELPGAMDGCGRGRPQPPTAPLENATRHAPRDSRRFPQLLGNPGAKPPGFPQLPQPRRLPARRQDNARKEARQHPTKSVCHNQPRPQGGLMIGENPGLMISGSHSGRYGAPVTGRGGGGRRGCRRG
jgi:hypothetical protein